MTIDNFDNPVQAEGYRAYTAGIPITANPYNQDTESFYAEQWINGWAWARTDHKQANREAQQEQP
jgi:ribosome modulation factor